MNTLNELWQYVCKSRNGGYDLIQFYVKNPNDIAKAFWHGVLTVLEIEGKITQEQGWHIWKEITE